MPRTHRPYDGDPPRLFDLGAEEVGQTCASVGKGKGHVATSQLAMSHEGRAAGKAHAAASARSILSARPITWSACTSKRQAHTKASP